MQVCFFCGAANSPGNRECHACGHAMPGHEDVPPPESPQGPEGEAVDFDCKYCSATIPAGQTVCPACQHQVVSDDPLDEPAPKSHDGELTERYQEFATKVEQLRLRQISLDDFAVWIQEMHGKLVQKRDEYVNLIKNSGYFDFNGPEVEMGLTGIFEFETAIEAMMKFVAGEVDQSALDDALQMMWTATEKVNEAMRINREFRNSLEDDWGYV